MTADQHLAAFDYDFVDDGLAVGSVDAIKASLAIQLGFGAVVTLVTTRDRPGIAWVERPRGVGVPDHVPHLHVEIADGEGPELGFEQGLDAHLDAIVEFSEHYRGRNLLVACGRGFSRSAAAASAILCWRRGWSVGGAVARVKQRRPGADPCEPFLAALDRWSLRRRGLTRPEAWALLKLAAQACEADAMWAIEEALEALDAVLRDSPAELRRLAEGLPPRSRRDLFDLACIAPAEARARSLIKLVLRSVRS